MKRKTYIIILVILILAGFIPIPGTTYRDGGTKEYNALTYKIVVWNRLRDWGTYHKTSVYWIPNNFRSIDELWEKESAKIEEEMTKDLSGNVYYWEKGGFGGAFMIMLQSGGKFAYYEGVLSSHIGFGTWSVSGRILTLKESGGDKVFLFYVGENEITFIKEGSSKFTYADVEDGDRFVSRSPSEIIEEEWDNWDNWENWKEYFF